MIAREYHGWVGLEELSLGRSHEVALNLQA